MTDADIKKIQDAQAALEQFAADNLQRGDGPELEKLDEFDQLMVLIELGNRHPAVGCGYPTGSATGAKVSTAEWDIASNGRRALHTLQGRDYEDAYSELCFTELLVLWYFHMDCDPWDQELFDKLNTVRSL